MKPAAIAWAAGFLKFLNIMKSVKGAKVAIKSKGRPNIGFSRRLEEGKTVIAATTKNGLDVAFAMLHNLATNAGWKDWSYISIGNSGPIYAKRTK